MKSPAPEQQSKNHWYDGTFFDLCVAPNQDPIFAAVRAAIPPGSTVLDVGCGTGRLVFQLAEQCSMVRGIDASGRNIRRARLLHTRRGKPPHIAFELTSIEAHLGGPHQKYDVGVISYVLHEVSEQQRVPMLRLLATAAQTVILADYRVPRRSGLTNVTTEVVERLAGREHYRGFRSFVRRGGLPGVVQEAGLHILGELTCAQQTAQVLRAAWAGP